MQNQKKKTEVKWQEEGSGKKGKKEKKEKKKEKGRDSLTCIP